MSNEEKITRAKCYSDFYRAATWYYKNPLGTTHLIFLNHGMKLLQELGITKLINTCHLIQKRLADAKVADIRLADKILTVGLLAKS